MKTVEYPICERCDQPIMKPEDGFIVHGNIYVAATAGPERGGLIGNAFPEPSEDGTIMASEVHEVCYCRKCFYEILNIKVGPTFRQGGAIVV